MIDLIIKAALAVILVGVAAFTTIITAAVVGAIIQDAKERKKGKDK